MIRVGVSTSGKSADFDSAIPQEFLQGLERLKDIRRPSVQATVGLLLNARPGTGPDTCESFFEGA